MLTGIFYSFSPAIDTAQQTPTQETSHKEVTHDASAEHGQTQPNESHETGAVHNNANTHEQQAEGGHTSQGEADSHHGTHHVHLNGSDVSLWWILPFIGILLSIAVFPLVLPHFWHHNYGKISLFWWITFMVPFMVFNGFHMGVFYIMEVYLGEFIPFIILLLALFTIAGGVRLTGSLRGSPMVNTVILLLGTVLASWMGTTGAAMLLIRPIIRANSWRKYRVHTIVFFIFLVANIGGSLTPLGDPPLFLGFLKGVSFFWTTTHMFLPMLFVSVILLVLYFIIDTLLYKKESIPPEDGTKEPLGLEGKGNLLLLLGVVAAVVISGIWNANINNPDHVIIKAYGTGLMTKGVLFQVFTLLLLAIISLKITKKSTREGNGFTWEPIVEVAKLFATIFITMVPAIAILKAGSDGALAPIINSVNNEAGPVNYMYFWCTGILSSFLDNAPTYVVFFNTAGGDAQVLMHKIPQTLLAISCGAVFMGANTYIGNAPNFMVRSIAEENKIKMPSFFGYMLWSFGILTPIFLLVTFIFF
ncbi:MAG: sodium:proton antiporter [Fibrobacteria bacterium]|nr:sodium:proton antiporter [Fibrobacteria bacterium]